MNPNYIITVIIILVAIAFFSCMIVGDVFLAKIAFNSEPMNCDTFVGEATTVPGTTVPGTTVPGTTVAPAAVAGVRHGTCAPLDNVEIGFAKFRIVLFWIMFIVSTGLSAFFGIGLLSLGTGGIIIIALGVILWIFMLVGGIYLSKFAIESSEKKCNNKVNYCYDLTDAQVFFARVTSVFCFPMTFATMGLFAFLAYRSL